MPVAEEFLLTMLAALAVGFLLRKTGLPGGMMLGAIIGAAALKILLGIGFAPSFIRYFAQSVAGGCFGASLDRQKLRMLPKLILPLLIIYTFLVLTDIGMALIMVKVSPFDSVTALTSGIAGGINDVPLIAVELGADAGKVAVLQFVRLITGIAGIPFLIRVLDKQARPSSDQKQSKEKAQKKSILWWETLLALGVALVGGYIGKLIGLPGGILLFSMLAVSLLHVTSGYGRIDPRIKVLAQWFSGAYIGCLLDREDVMELRFLLLPALIICCGFILNAFVTSFLLGRVTKMSFRESMLACCPAGASEIALLSSDLNIGAELSTDIMVIHVFRVMLAVAVTPQLIPLIARLF